MSKYLLFLIVYLLPLSLPAQKQPKSAEEFVDEIDKKIPQILKDFSIPGAAIAIMVEGELVLKKGYGFADMENGIKIDLQTGFNAGSISKTLTAWGIMKLVNEGKLELDTPAENYLTRWRLPDSEFDSNEVTIRRLLSHTAGLSLPSVSAEHSFDELPSLVEWLDGQNEGLGPLEIVLEPGSRWEYSGGGYGMLQLIIEEVSGQGFENYMQKEVLDPLGMTHSSFKIDEKIKARSATPYDSFGEVAEFGLYSVQAAAGLHTTLEDFIKFAIASLPDHPEHEKYNSVLPPEVVGQMLEAAPHTRVRAWKYGLGYQSVHLDSRVFIGHAGSNTGWEANFRIDAPTKTGFIVFTNGGAGGNICNPLFCELINWTSAETRDNDCWPKLSVANLLQAHIEKNGTKDIRSAYENLKKEHGEEYDFSESQLNNLGYHYLAKEEVEKAIVVFKLNTQLFSFSSNVYDSYGEALLAKGYKKQAIENYKYSIRLNPENENGIKVLKNLGASLADIHLDVPVEQLHLFAGEYLASSGSDKIIRYEVRKGELLRTYTDTDFTIRLIPIAQNEFVYMGRGLHVVFESREPNTIILKVPGEGEYKKKGE